ncbi:MAG: aminopeptidase P N-terminal domain-containing protein, partial [Natronospirillum sp.]
RALEIWNGYRLGPEGVVATLGADEAYDHADMDEHLPELLAEKSVVYSPMGADGGFDAQVMAWVNHVRARARQGVSAPVTFKEVSGLIHEMRLFKSPAEAEVMRRAGQISSEAHVRAWRSVARAEYEYQLEAELNHEFAWQGAPQTAYPSIVGSGVNACILHYTENSDRLSDGNLVLIDAGCELDGYASDITRTFPANGRFSPEQRAIYDLVLRAHQAALDAVRPGQPMRQPHHAAVGTLTAGLVELGLLQGEPEKLMAAEAYREFFMHGTSHWLGMDVHDVGAYKVNGEWRLFEPGMCLTIEPGLYIAPDNEAVESRWRGIGVRIEDDVMVTVDGHENFTRAVPKDPDEIERLMAKV